MINHLSNIIFVCHKLFHIWPASYRFNFCLTIGNYRMAVQNEEASGCSHTMIPQPSKACTRLMIFFHTLCLCKYYSLSLKIVANLPLSFPWVLTHFQLVYLEIPTLFPAAIQESSLLGSLFNYVLICFSSNFCISPEFLGLIYFVGLNHLLGGGAHHSF